MSEQTNISFEAALMIALRADAQKELDTLPTPEQLEELYPDKPGKSYRLEYSATFSYSDGRSETITGSTSR